MEEMKKLIKASVKRETKKKAQFEVDEKVLPKPPRSASDIFNKELTAKAKATGTKVQLKERQEQWSKLSDSEKDKYIKKCEDAKAHYKAEYAKLRQQAIDAGDIPSDAPKKALTTYFLFRAHMLNELKPKYLLTPKEEQLPEDQKKKLKHQLWQEPENLTAQGVAGCGTVKGDGGDSVAHLVQDHIGHGPHRRRAGEDEQKPVCET
jgi:hypothetical protein